MQNEYTYYKSILNESNIEGDLSRIEKDSHFNEKTIRENLPNKLVDKKRNIYTIETSGSSGVLASRRFQRYCRANSIWEWEGFGKSSGN